MNTGFTRRGFVGAAAAGLPFAVGSVLIARSPQEPHAHDAGGSPRDAVVEHLLAQLVATHNRATTRGVSGEDGRTAAATLRTLEIYAAQTGLDTQVRSGVRQLVARRGREAVLWADADTAAMRDELRRLGLVSGTIEFGRFGAPDDATRRRVLERLSRDGVSRRFAELASQLQQVATQIDRRGGPWAAPFRPVQESYGGNCSWMADQMYYLEVEVAIACGAAAVFPGLASVCAALSITLGIEMLAYRYWC
jgi:hypothetical protein